MAVKTAPDLRVSKRNFILIICTGFVFLLFFGLALLSYFLITGKPEPTRHLFVVDLLETHVPDFSLPLHRSPGGHLENVEPPLAFGTIRFDSKQLVVDWNIKQTFTSLYHLRDLTLRGPISKNESFAPTVLALGVEMNSARRLVGKAEISKELLKRVIEHPRRYYLSLEGDYAHTEQSSEATEVHEIARHNLIWKR